MRWSHTEIGWMGFFRSLADGRVYLRHEITFKGLSPERAAKDITSKMREWKIERLTYIAAQPELWPKAGETGETVRETFSRAGLPMLRGSGDRRNRWSRLRSWLDMREWKTGETDRDGKPTTFQSPSLLIHPECVRLIRTLPTLVADTSDPDDVDETPEEYPAAGVSFYAMSRPLPFQAEGPILPDGAVGHLVNEMRAEAEA